MPGYKVGKPIKRKPMKKKKPAKKPIKRKAPKKKKK
jgi:hypothetical protein|tara:strand:- start:850 stop:957 length:108 start_codon:yes stop_codon:yes gene_type:complete